MNKTPRLLIDQGTLKHLSDAQNQLSKIKIDENILRAIAHAATQFQPFVEHYKNTIAPVLARIQDENERFNIVNKDATEFFIDTPVVVTEQITTVPDEKKETELPLSKKQRAEVMAIVSQALIDKENNKQQEDSRIILYFDDKFNLSREVGNKKYSCVVKGASQVYILKSITYQFQKTEVFSNALDSTVKSINEIIGKINRKGRISLKLDESLIENVPSIGYRLNSKYEIKFL